MGLRLEAVSPGRRDPRARRAHTAVRSITPLHRAPGQRTDTACPSDVTVAAHRHPLHGNLSGSALKCLLVGNETKVRKTRDTCLQNAPGAGFCPLHNFSIRQGDKEDQDNSDLTLQDKNLIIHS